ncbi:hypothetical protein [Ochrobactrum sp. EDr1-4]|uniref:hypothetical protein n=1 Tax=Ochrobactrum sp. EDr1-4 TaxID=3368622 RepID=UPI003B9E5B5D
MTQRLVGAGFALLGILVVILAMQLPQPLAATRIAYGPGFFPLLLGMVIAAAGTWLALIGPGQAIDKLEGERYSLSNFAKPAVVFGAALIYVFYSQQFGPDLGSAHSIDAFALRAGEFYSGTANSCNDIHYSLCRLC